jgi:hypothetical protein
MTYHESKDKHTHIHGRMIYGQTHMLCRPQLVDLDLGSCMPIINGLKLSTCPGTGAVAAPQLQLDVCYEVSLVQRP